MKKVIVAADVSTKDELFQLMKKFEQPAYIKLGMEAIYAMGFDILFDIEKQGHEIFLDLKLHDIPNTVKKAMKNIAKYPIHMVNVHAAGGSAMMKAALEGLMEGANGKKRPFLIAVTQLTSTDQETLENELLIKENLNACVLHYAKLAKESGLDGVVCSVHEVKEIHEICGENFLTITPGIRFDQDQSHDQKRVATPNYAYHQGSDFIVVGRSITNAQNVAHTYQQIQQIMEGK